MVTCDDVIVGLKTLAADDDSGVVITLKTVDISIWVAIRAPINVVWAEFNEPRSIVAWDAAPDWYTVSCTNDVRVGGCLKQHIEPRGDGEPFLFSARYVRVEPLRVLEWQTREGQRVRVEFADKGGLIQVKQTFSADPTVSVEVQRADWQGVLDSFARHVERSIK